jgi:hypothetical protein
MRPLVACRFAALMVDEEANGFALTAMLSGRTQHAVRRPQFRHHETAVAPHHKPLSSAQHFSR